MKIAIIGLGNQGMKRLRIAGSDVVCTVDPKNPQATHKSIYEINELDIDAAILCLPDSEKIEAITHFLNRGCHVLVEKPLVGDNMIIDKLKQKFLQNELILQTAYNHRFEPHFQTIKEIISHKQLGRLYKLEIHYGNGTSKLVKDSTWRDKDLGILPDIGSHLLDLIEFWFGEVILKHFLETSHTNLTRNEVSSFDSFSIRGEVDDFHVDLSGTYLNWKNRFFLELIGSEGSIEMNGLCKWGPSELSIRRRTLPAGSPSSKSEILIQDDPTWKLEYDEFKSICITTVPKISNVDIMVNGFFESTWTKLLNT